MAPKGYSGGYIAGGLLALYGNISTRGTQVEPLCRLPLPGACRVFYIPQITLKHYNYDTLSAIYRGCQKLERGCWRNVEKTAHYAVLGYSMHRSAISRSGDVMHWFSYD